MGLISWWYGRGWVGQWQRNGQLLMRTFEFFSIGQLLQTLFSPFRQISAGSRDNGSLRSMLSVAGDKLISSLIGALVRSATIICGLIVIAVQSLYVVVSMVLWWAVPLLPLVGLALFMIDWVPYG